MGTSEAKALIILFFSISEGQVEVLNPFSGQLSVSLLLSSSSLFVVWLWKRSVTPFVSITSLSKQRFGRPTCRSPGAGHSSPWASQDYPQRRRQLRPGEGAINLHKLQPATLPPLSLDTQIMHLLLNSPQTESRGDKVISWFPTTEKLFLKVLLQSRPWLMVQHFLTLQMGRVAEVSWGFVAWKNVFLILGYFWFREHCPFLLLQETFTNGTLCYAIQQTKR